MSAEFKPEVVRMLDVRIKWNTSPQGVSHFELQVVEGTAVVSAWPLDTRDVYMVASELVQCSEGE
jgi:hypothetical protein